MTLPLPTLLELPTDRPRTAKPTFQHLRQRIQISLFPRSSAGPSDRLAATILAAFEVLLFRYTGQNELVIGCHRSPFGAAPVPVRAELSGSPCLSAVVEQVMQAWQAAAS